MSSPVRGVRRFAAFISPVRGVHRFAAFISPVRGVRRFAAFTSRVRGVHRFAAFISGLCFVLMVVGVVGLYLGKVLISHAPAGMAAQIAAVALMLWARITFGRRSFHATADPTAGGLITNGPYAFFRHPIYTAVGLFTLASALTYRTPAAFAWLALVFAGAIGRMLCEETLLRERFPEYAAYSRRTARMVPFLF